MFRHKLCLFPFLGMEQETQKRNGMNIKNEIQSHLDT